MWWWPSTPRKHRCFPKPPESTLIRRALDKAGCKNVTVSSTDGLITDYCKKVGATVIIKGLRQNGDYEAELGMALVNRKLAGIETLFFAGRSDS